MLRFFSTTILLSCIFLLSACDAYRGTGGEYVPPANSAGSYCISRCKIALRSCMQICALKNSSCAEEMKEKATRAYEAYKADRRHKGYRIRKRYKDFYRTATCSHPCNCIPAYNTCYRACGGKIYW